MNSNKYLSYFKELHKKRLIKQDKENRKLTLQNHLIKRKYIIPQDLMSIILTYIPELDLIWLSNGDFTFNYKSTYSSLHSTIKIKQHDDEYLNQEENYYLYYENSLDPYEY